MNSKQNPPRKMHIIPACYISEFCNSDGKVWANRYMDEIKKKSRMSSPRGVGYKINYYKLPPLRDLDLVTASNLASLPNYNEHFVESSINTYYEQKIKKMFPWFKGRSNELTIDDKYLFCGTILHFMARNPRVRNTIFFNEALMKDAGNVKVELRKEFSKQDIEELERQGIDFEQYLDIAMELYISNLRNAKNEDLHNNFIIEQHRSETDKKKSFLWALVQGRWEVLETNTQAPFILTDCPGNFSSPQGQDEALSYPFEMYFPLNSLQLLKISGPNSHKGTADLLTIRYLKIGKHDVDKVNYFLAESCVEEIYCSSRETIEAIRNRKYPQLT